MEAGHVNHRGRPREGRGDMMARRVAMGETLQQVADYFGVSRVTVWEAAKIRGVQSKRKQGKWRRK